VSIHRSRGNALQAAGVCGGSAPLARAATLNGPGVLRTGLILAVHLNCHRHYAAAASSA